MARAPGTSGSFRSEAKTYQRYDGLPRQLCQT